MSYLMKHVASGSISTVELRGTKTADAALEIWSNLQALIVKEKPDRLLVIDEMDDELTVWDVVDIETHLSASGFPRGVFLAIVDQALRKERNSNSFGELYLLNRGWHRIRMFETRDLALAWLNSGEGYGAASESSAGS